MKKKLNENLIKIFKCPICFSSSSKNIGKIENCNSTDLSNIFDLLECKKCGHKFLSKFPKKNYLENLYKEDSDYVFGHSKSEVISKANFIKYKFSKQKSYKKHWIFDFINLNKKGNYLEIGPGLCNLYKSFYEKKWNCEGVELQKWIKAPGIKKNYNRLSKKKNDVIVMFDVLEHIIDPNSFLKNISKKIKKNGKLFLTFPNASSYRSKILKTEWQMVSPLAHLNFFSIESAKIMLKKNGYQIEHISPCSFVELRRLIRNSMKLPFKIILDLIKFDLKSIVLRLKEFSLNILDLIHGDQMRIVAIKS
tara:strand:+ start:644 stop:1564 length:921 start_codon:yes stop_codon:yes gene_type:complete